MSLRSKIALVVFVTVALFMGVDELQREFNVSRQLEAIQVERANQAWRRVLERFEASQNELDLVADAAAHRYVDAELSDDARELFEQLREWDADVLAVLDAEGRVLRRCVGPELLPGAAKLRELPNEQLFFAHEFMRSWGDDGVVRGLWSTSLGQIQVASTTIESEAERNVRVVIGRCVDPRLAMELREASGAKLTLTDVGERSIEPFDQSTLVRARQTPELWIDASAQDESVAWAAIDGIGGLPALLLAIQPQDDLRSLWGRERRDAFASALAIAVLFPFVILVLLQAVVTGPLRRLTKHVVQIGHSDDTSARLDLKRSDEIGQLAHEFDSMLEKLAASRSEVIRTARLAGISAIVSDVMHNVGNTLNSVHVAARLTQDQAEGLRPNELRLVLGALEANEGDLDRFLAEDARGRRLLPLLRALIERTDSRVDALVNEATTLGDGIDEIGSLISALQSVDARVNVVERVDVAAVAERAIEFASAPADKERIRFERDVAEIELIEIDRNRLTEVLVHVTRNAVQAVSSETVSDPTVTLRVESLGADRFVIEIADNGAGIDPTELERIFALGHTSKPEARGLGLHLASTAAGELGGHLTASSAGRGMGASFRLELPKAAATRTEPEASGAREAA